MKTKLDLFKTTLLMLTLLSLLMLVSCIEDNTPTPDENYELTAVIDYSPETPEVDEEVSVNAYASIDPDMIGYEATWALVTTPDGSKASMATNTSLESSFTPDLEGTYEVSLTITNDENEISDTATKSIMVVAKGTTELSGSYSEDLILEDIHEDPDQADYLVVDNLYIGAKMSVAPGVVIHVQENKAITILESGTISAEGTAQDSITFTSANIEGATLWKGIFIQSGTSQNKLSYTNIAYAGNSEIDFTGANYKAAVGVGASGKANIDNSTFANNEGYAVYADDDGGLLANFTANHFASNEHAVGVWAGTVDAIDESTTFESNSQSDVTIFASTHAEGNETTWSKLNGSAAYTLAGDLKINGTLTLSPGVQFHIVENVDISVYGALIAKGDATDGIVFTSKSPEENLHWQGIYIGSADGRNALEYVTISYAGSSDFDFTGYNHAAACGVESDGKISVTNSRFENNLGYGLYLDDDGGQLGTFAKNTFINNDRAVGLPANEAEDLDSESTFTNNANADVEIFSSTYGASNTSTWPSLGNDASYRVSGNLYIEGALTVDAGALFEVDEDKLITVSGSLTANGTAANHVVFTSSNLSGGLRWKGLYFTSSSSLNHLTYTEVAHAGNSPIDFSGTNHAAGIGVDRYGKISLTNCTVTDHTEFGLYIDNDGGQIETFTTNHFENNEHAIGLPANEVDAIDGATTFSNNSQSAVAVFASDLADTKTVTWNKLSQNAAYRIRGNVEIDGVLTIAPGTTLTMDEDVQLEVYGALIAEGSSAEIITFTSSNIQGGLLWKGIFIQSSDSRNSLNHTLISYGGKSDHEFFGENFSANVGVNRSGNLTITNSTISNSGGYGVYSIGTTNAFSGASANNTFMNNPLGNSQ
ncbi:PKD domain-containing protein [Marinoscillum furvescens]|uniref:Parallel beta helix pectate lyase-like protein n=1 Tax=Marinoscillum furvescens DSM 4134 TaxID=1122208 RepID=A0A3D9L2P3_MARFU|nr:PKD domain-containing protein [Marinoscillum furvescens]RED99409.1 hypothetical protein C7460_10825 [Marinoscillum furvescens DSM 4134]